MEEALGPSIRGNARLLAEVVVVLVLVLVILLVDSEWTIRDLTVYIYPCPGGYFKSRNYSVLSMVYLTLFGLSCDRSSSPNMAQGKPETPTFVHHKSNPLRKYKFPKIQSVNNSNLLRLPTPTANACETVTMLFSSFSIDRYVTLCLLYSFILNKQKIPH